MEEPKPAQTLFRVFPGQLSLQKLDNLPAFDREVEIRCLDQETVAPTQDEDNQSHFAKTIFETELKKLPDSKVRRQNSFTKLKFGRNLSGMNSFAASRSIDGS